MIFSKEHLIEKEKRQDLIKYLFKRIFVDDWLIKLTALAISFSLWLGVAGLQKTLTRKLRQVPFSPLTNQELEITNSPIQEIDITVSGDQRKIEQLNERDFTVSMDLRDIEAGDRTIQITPQNITINLPSGVKIDKIEPDKFEIKLERIQEAVVPIKIETEGDLADGYEIYESKINPENIRIRGPESFVKSLNFVSTEKIKLESHKSDFIAPKVPINTTTPKIRPVDILSVSVSFKIGRKRIERLFVVPYETELRKGKASILLFGADNILENLSSEEIEIIEESDTENPNLLVVLPENIRNQIRIKSTKFRE